MSNRMAALFALLAALSCVLSFKVLLAVGTGLVREYYTWFEAGNVAVGFTLRADGLTAVMLVTVTQRTREIGIRKATGALRRQILYQFLLEALVISGIGAVLGILIAIAILIVIRPFLPEGMTIPISGLSVVAAFVVSCATGIIFGYLPASRAAKA